MHARSLRGKRGRSSDPGADRAAKITVLLAVTIVLLLIGFSGPSVYFTLPGPTGWLYLGVVIVAATVALVWLCCVDDRQKRANTSRLITVNRKSKRIPAR